LPDTGHVDGPRAKPEPECRCMAYKVHHLRTLNDILAWQARNVGTRTPDQSPLDHRHALPRSRQVPSDVLAGLAATHDDILEMLEAGHRALVATELRRDRRELPLLALAARLEQEPGPPLSLVDPVLEQARARHVAV